MNKDKLYSDIMNIPCTRTMSHFATTHEMRAYKEGHRDARHAAAIVLTAQRVLGVEASTGLPEQITLKTA